MSKKDTFVTISENDTELVRAKKTATGVLIKSVTKDKDGNTEAIYHLDGGVLVNHGSEKEPDWQLNR